MTKNEIIDFFNANASEAKHFMYECPNLDLFGEVVATCVDSYGGEDCGSTYYAVWKFVTPDGEEFYLRFDGWYASHYGCDYQGFAEVRPKEVTKVEYV